LAFGHIKMRFFFLFPLFALVAGCDSSLKPPDTYYSPSKKFAVDVTTELQGANDPEPIWQHISLRKSDKPRILKGGNLIVYSSSTPPDIIWKDDAHLQLILKDVGYTFDKLGSPEALNDIDLEIVFYRPAKNRKAEQGAAANP